MENVNKRAEGHRIYLLVTVTIAPKLVGEFNEFWAREILPFWEKYGARHIRSFVYKAGGPSNQLLRLFEFDDYASWGTFREALEVTEEGKEIVKVLYSKKWDIVAEMSLLKSIL